jgi:hypothetical protein
MASALHPLGDPVFSEFAAVGARGSSQPAFETVVVCPTLLPQKNALKVPPSLIQ